MSKFEWKVEQYKFPTNMTVIQMESQYLQPLNDIVSR